MGLSEDALNPTVSAIGITCFLAFIISVTVSFLTQIFTNPKRKTSCYLITESKPQQAFKHVLADNSYLQFNHLKLRKDDDPNSDGYSNLHLHPYKGEISKLIKTPNLEFIDGFEVGFERGLSYTWIDTQDELFKLVEELESEKVFAVDTEQHSFRSFLGFTALVQISTKRRDFLVDTIALHDSMRILRPVFADPGICKVFHGADNDILWLQRDFHIYVVNLFDTAKACDILSKPQRSLAYLLETYCDVTTNKSLQREDWRQRPLPLEMLEYAQMDAHYLLYISSCLSMELKQHNIENQSPGGELHFLLEASRRSNAICMQLFAKDFEALPGELAAASLISRAMNCQGNASSNLCDNKFQDLVRRLCLWRDLMARIHDESLRFVLPDTSIIALATEVPSSQEDIFKTISKAKFDDSVNLMPSQPPSPVVGSHLNDLLYLLQESAVTSDNIFELCLRKRLSSAGNCPISVYNRALLSTASLGITNRSTSTRKGFRSSKLVAKKTSRELYVKKFSCKSPVYHNCKIYSNDGRLLCYCDRRKLEWYLNRNLAKILENDPPSIMLLFEPKGRPEDEDNVFYIQSKKNICVSCGETNHYLRYRIIPACYRIYFPEHLKSHRSHDIVLLCVDCHEIAHAAAEKYKRRIAEEFGIPLLIEEADNELNSSSSFTTLVDSKETNLLRASAMALLRHGHQIPPERRDELSKIVMAYYGGREVSEVDIERVLIDHMSLQQRRRFEKKKGFAFKYLPFDQNEEKNRVHVKKGTNEINFDVIRRKESVLGHGIHGKKIVLKLLKEYGEDGIVEFCQRWRQVFVQALNPRFLPAGWDVMHRGKREFGDFSIYNPTVKSSAI